MEKGRRGIFIKQHSITIINGFLLFALTAACTDHDNDPEITMLDAVEKSREEIMAVEEVNHAATSFDVERFIQFRMMTEKFLQKRKLKNCLIQC